jgi:hypothetical protein
MLGLGLIWLATYSTHGEKLPYWQNRLAKGALFVEIFTE